MTQTKRSRMHRVIAVAIILVAVMFAFRFIDATGLEVLLVALSGVVAYLVGARLLFGKRVG